MSDKKKYPFRWITVLLLRNPQATDQYSLVDDLEIEYKHLVSVKGYFWANIWYTTQIIRTLLEMFKTDSIRRMTMFKNYIKIAIRNLIRNKLFSLINIVGLAIGLSICMLISLWVQRECNYDRFHSKADRIFRIERKLFRDNQYSRWPIVGGQYKQALIDDYPEIIDAVRIWRRKFSIKDYNNFAHPQEMFAVDNSFFKIFDFDLEEGDPANALTEPKTVVLTRKIAFKYFGTDDVIGRSLTFEWNDEPTPFKVTGILKEIPKNSHIQFDMLMSITSYSEDNFDSWRSNYLFTYVLVSENTKRYELEEKLKSFVEAHLEAHYGDLLAQGFEIHKVLRMHLFPIGDIHLHPSPNWELEPGGSMTSVYIFSTIAVLILLIACINFVNLSTARASKRAKEVSLRKTVGAWKSQLRTQFIQESILLASIAMILALIICLFLIPFYERVFADTLHVTQLFQIQNIILLFGTTILAGFLAGLYPAFYLTRFEPATIFKGSLLVGHRKSSFRRNMVILQFVISIVLIIGMFTVYEQMVYIRNRPLGFDKENMVLLPIRSRQVVEHYESFRNTILNQPDVLAVTSSLDVPGEQFYSNTNFLKRYSETDDPVLLIMIFTDYHFIDTYNMEMLAGRGFSKTFATDTSGTVILNEAAVRRLGWTPDEAIGKELLYSIDTVGKIVGVVKDFNFRSLHTVVEPMALTLFPDFVSDMSIRIKPDNINKTLSYLENEWRKAFPGEQFEYTFLDERMVKLYSGEKKMQNIFIVFTTFSIFIACLGLLGLAAFTAEVRTKEIGIRKTLGASVSSVLVLLLKEFVKWVAISSVVAWPLAYYMMSQWLQNFAYRTSMKWWTFILSGILALLVTILTVGFQITRAAQTNPVESLRYE